jgi:hypothetical protein
LAPCFVAERAQQDRKDEESALPTWGGKPHQDRPRRNAGVPDSCNKSFLKTVLDEK